MNETKNLQITLSLPEVNQVLEGLGQLPYAQVFRLINTIQTQADTQLKKQDKPSQTETKNE